MNAQHIILQALENAVHEAVITGKLEPEVFDSVPQSHVFYRPEEGWDEDEVEAMQLVGAQDVQNKIAYYTSVLNGAA